jgi:DNA-binding MarR family transcriptional regulator
MTSVKGLVVADAGFGYNVLFEVWLVARATIGLLDDAIAPSGLTADEFGVYSVFCTGDCRASRSIAMTPTELAQWMSAPPTTVSSYVKRFEARGHFERRPNPADRRSYTLRLTPAGHKAHQRAATYFGPAMFAVVAALGRNEPTARRSLEHIKHAIDTVVEQRLSEAEGT